MSYTFTVLQPKLSISAVVENHGLVLLKTACPRCNLKLKPQAEERILMRRRNQPSLPTVAVARNVLLNHDYHAPTLRPQLQLQVLECASPSLSESFCRHLICCFS